MPTTPTAFAKRARPVPNRLIGLNRVDLIGNENIALDVDMAETFCAVF